MENNVAVCRLFYGHFIVIGMGRDMEENRTISYIRTCHGFIVPTTH